MPERPSGSKAFVTQNTVLQLRVRYHLSLCVKHTKTLFNSSFTIF